MTSDKIIIDLKDIVEERAWNFYLRTRKRFQPKTLKNVDLVFDWSEVTFEVKTPEFTEKKGTEHFVTNVIFKSVFDNNSAMPQTHSLKAERQTTASCKASLSKSFTTNTNMGLTLEAPGSVVKASVGFSSGFSVNYTKETTDQKTLTWVSEGSLTVPSNSKLTAELEIIERHSEYTFKSAVAITGTVIVNIHSKKDNNKFLKTYTGDMKTILKDKYKDLKTEGSRTVFLDIEGDCDFKYGIEQQIKIS